MITITITVMLWNNSLLQVIIINITTITIMLLRTHHPFSLLKPVVTLPPLQNTQKN